MGAGESIRVILNRMSQAGGVAARKSIFGNDFKTSQMRQPWLPF